MEIVFYGKMFLEWGGGVDFLRIMLNGLNATNVHEQHKLHLVVPQIHLSKFTRIKYHTKRIINAIAGKTLWPAILPKAIDNKQVLELFKEEYKVNIVFIEDGEKELTNFLNTLSNPVLLPCFFPMSPKFPFPWVGYIYDFQHKYYPEFFNDKERRLRDVAFEEMLRKAPAVLVNSKAVKADAIKFFPLAANTLFSLPFCPLYSNNTQSFKFDAVKIDAPFFLISNQFWRHKNHGLAFEAMHILKTKFQIQNVRLVCTGTMNDYRFPDYGLALKQKIKELNLENEIILTGYVSKTTQLGYLRKCIALVQPTLFEGGPGGGAVYEALAWDKQVLVSNIPINLEIDNPLCTFFESNNAYSLAEKMKTLLDSSQWVEPLSEAQKAEQKLILGRSILQIIEAAKQSHGKGNTQ